MAPSLYAGDNFIDKPPRVEYPNKGFSNEIFGPRRVLSGGFTGYVVEINHPTPQITRLNGLFEEMRNGDPPKTSDEFEDRALI